MAIEERQLIEPVLPVRAPKTNGHRRHNLQLLLANLKSARNDLRGGAALAFTSASGGEVTPAGEHL
jgi:hypothetical protein